MTKDQLKDGDRLTLRNGNISFYNNEYDDYSYDNNLIYLGGYYPEYDIVKVERIQVDKEALEDCINEKGKADIDDINENLTYQTIWERDELTNLLQNDNKCVDLSNKIEPLKPLYRHEDGFNIYYQYKSDSEVLADKINEIVEVINNGIK